MEKNTIESSFQNKLTKNGKGSMSQNSYMNLLVIGMFSTKLKQNLKHELE